VDRIGIAGLGRMGAAMAARLLETGAAVTVWNRSPERCEPLRARGATVAATPAAVAAASDIVLTILTDAVAIEAVYGAPDGLLAAASGKLFIEMSTVRPAVTVALGERISAAGGRLVDCPVGGTVDPARQGRLLGLLGGTAADADRARPVLERLCRRVEHVGPLGAGASMKLAINLPLALYYQALAEAVTLCRHLGHDPAWLVDLFGDTTGGSNVLRVRGPAIARALAGEAEGFTGFDIDGVRKDMRAMLEEADALGRALPVTRATLAVYDQAAAAGWGARDGAALPAWWPVHGGDSG
jgi:3-hydroxyisobutyrate dehydrogenase